MKLKELKIQSDFKNLKGIQVKFHQGVNSYVLIGNNGSGKTSLLEAVSAIFDELYYGNGKDGFAYFIRYEINDHNIVVVRTTTNKLVCKADNEVIDVAVLRANYLPSRLICNYSGEDSRIKDDYFQKRYDDYIQDLKKQNGNAILRMLFVDKNMWRIIFLIMLICKDEIESFKQFLEGTVGYKTLDTISLEIETKALAGWQDNAVKYYLSLIGANMHDGKIALSDINPLTDSAQTLFIKWMSALPLIKRLSIAYNGGVSSDYLSEGEKKLMTILFIQEAIADEQSLVLLDEPDSHIHVARKEELKTILSNVDNRESILTSHSPTLTAKYTNDAIIMLDRTEEGLATVISQEKKDIVAKLTNGIWSLQEQNIFLASKKDVLIVEGKTDETFLSKALLSLQRNQQYLKQDFMYLPCGGASEVGVMLKRFSPKPGQLAVALFDSDTAGWNAINKIFDRTGNQCFPSTPFGRARKLNDIWYAVYPSCKRGVTNFNVEDYFPRTVFLKHIMSFKGLEGIWTKDKLKSEIANDCLNNAITDKQYKNFEKVFSLIEDIRMAEKAGQVKI